MGVIIEPYLAGLVALVFVAVIIYALTRPGGGSTPDENASAMIDIENPSSQAKTITVSAPFSTFTLESGSTTRVVVASGATISSEATNFDGTVTKRSLRISRATSIKKIYITEDGVHTDSSARHADLINISEIPVIFIEIGSDGRRWPKMMVPPGNRCPTAVVAIGSTWEVVHPEREDRVLDRIKVHTLVDAIVFDGEILSVA